MTVQLISLINYYEQLPVAVYICDRNDELLEYNYAAAALFGIRPRTGTKDWYPSLEKFDEEGRQINSEYKPITAALRLQADSYRQEIRFRMPDGSDRYVIVSSVALRDGAGVYDGAIHTLVDATAARQAESEHALLAAIVESSEDAIIAKSLDGEITSWNRAAEHMFGYTAGEAIGKPINLIIPKERLAEEKRIIEAIRNGKKVEHFETVRLSKAGMKIPISLTISPILNASGKVVGASKIARNITEKKEAEKLLLKHTVHLEQMVAKRTIELDQALRKERELGLLKSRFVSMASHEFRTPLSSIKLSVSLIEKYAESYQDPHIQKHVAKIKNSVNDLATILGDFLSLEKLESGKLNVTLNEFDLTAFCRETTVEILCCIPNIF